MTEPSTLTRRRFLTAGVVALGTAAHGSQSVAASPQSQHSVNHPEIPKPTELDHIEARDVRAIDQRWSARSDTRVVNGVSDLGLDATGQQAVDTQLQAAADRGEVVELPPGDYRLGAPVTTESDGWGIRGVGDSPRDVRLHGTGRMLLIDQNGGQNVLLEDFTMVNGDGRGVGMSLTVDRGLTVRNVHHVGLSPREGVSGDMEEFNHQECSLTLQVRDPQGVGVVDGFVKTSPTEVSGHAENDSAFASWAQHRGLVYVRNSRVHNAGGDGATYVSRAPGGWRFTNCVFVDNHATALRLGGGRSWARRCTIQCNYERSRRVNDLLGGGKAPGMNPIVWESASAISPVARNEAGGLVDGCRIEMLDIENGCRGGITVDGSHGGIVVRNTTIRNDTRYRSITVDAPGSSFMNDFETPNRPHPVYLQNVTLTGQGSGDAIVANRRVVESNLTVSMPNAEVSGSVEVSGDQPPPFATTLLAKQNGVPAPAQVIGASGRVSGVGTGAFGAGVAVLSVVAMAVLLLVALVAVAPLVLFDYFLN
ncbi:hypothetical protein [Halomarina oriensis]|uniref:Right handed beta helix domain-containing protein n=1 Tax=Halomarina oriensis TaxID=671145 RepID=A0A6B0GP81_9EURY|nr:hypothetical protein [Halomarina oriensis]MWG36614.1 hypothetical protein [Halomarina oriensis]